MANLWYAIVVTVSFVLTAQGPVLANLQTGICQIRNVRMQPTTDHKLYSTVEHKEENLCLKTKSHQRQTFLCTDIRDVTDSESESESDGIRHFF